MFLVAEGADPVGVVRRIVFAGGCFLGAEFPPTGFAVLWDRLAWFVFAGFDDRSERSGGFVVAFADDAGCDYVVGGCCGDRIQRGSGS
ncbi:hypothetical protein A3852_12925 [Rhodococcus qingshengii]|nr:hypothetical protein A3852_12925 [Rhodococcus qingshengii]